MRQEKIGFGIILRIALSLVPILFGVSFPAMVWCSFNIAMSYIVFGPVNCIISSLSAICISMFFHGMYGGEAMIHGLFLALEAIFCAVACIYTVSKRKEFFSGVWLAAAGYLVPGVISLKMQARDAGVNIAHLLTDEPMKLLKMQFEYMNKDLMLNIEQGFFDEVLDVVHTAMLEIIPSVLVISAVLVGYVVMWCVCARLRKMPTGIKHSFSEIKVPKTMLLVMLLSLIVYFLNINSAVSSVALNIFVILLYLCSFAGISLIDYYMRKPIKIVFLRILIHFAVFMVMSTLILFVYMLSGIVDSFADFRKIGKRRQSCETEE